MFFFDAVLFQITLGDLYQLCETITNSCELRGKKSCFKRYAMNHQYIVVITHSILWMDWCKRNMHQIAKGIQSSFGQIVHVIKRVVFLKPCTRLIMKNRAAFSITRNWLSIPGNANMKTFSRQVDWTSKLWSAKNIETAHPMESGERRGLLSGQPWKIEESSTFRISSLRSATTTYYHELFHLCLFQSETCTSTFTVDDALWTCKKGKSKSREGHRAENYGACGPPVVLQRLWNRTRSRAPSWWSWDDF